MPDVDWTRHRATTMLSRCDEMLNGIRNLLPETNDQRVALDALKATVNADRAAAIVVLYDKGWLPDA